MFSLDFAGVVVLCYCDPASRYGQSGWGNRNGYFCLASRKRRLVPPSRKYSASQELSTQLRHTCAKL